MIEIDWQQLTLVCMLAATFAFGVLACQLIDIVRAQEFDPCFVDNDMFQRICDKQQIENILEQLLERAKEWNAKK